MQQQASPPAGWVLHSLGGLKSPEGRAEAVEAFQGIFKLSGWKAMQKVGRGTVKCLGLSWFLEWQESH